MQSWASSICIDFASLGFLKECSECNELPNRLRLHNVSFCQIQSNFIGNHAKKLFQNVERSASVDIKIIKNFKYFKNSPTNLCNKPDRNFQKMILCTLAVPRISLGIKPDQLWPCAYWTLNKNVGLGWVCEFKVSCWVFFVWVRKNGHQFSD